MVFNIMDIQERKTIKANILSPSKKEIPDGFWTKCPECNEIIYNGELDRNLRICSRCSYYFPMEPSARISFFANEENFIKFDDNICPDIDLCEHSVMGGKARLSSHELAILAVNIGSRQETDDILISEKIMGIINHAVEENLPLLAIYTLENGKQDHEHFSAQRLNISAVISRLAKKNLAYLSVLSQASADSNFPAFAYLADIVIAESHFLGTSSTGSRIGHRESELATHLLFENGVVDMVVPREDLKEKVIDILNFFC